MDLRRLVDSHEKRRRRHHSGKIAPNSSIKSFPATCLEESLDAAAAAVQGRGNGSDLFKRILSSDAHQKQARIRANLEMSAHNLASRSAIQMSA